VSLAVAVPLGVCSALVYGTSIVFQHSESFAHGQTNGHGLRGMLTLLRNPKWVMAVLGDFIGFLLMVAALSAGSVVVVQPLTVLMLPVALIVGWLLGGPKPRFGDVLGSLGIIAGLAGFLLLIGHPSVGHVPRPRYISLTILVVLGVGLVAAFAVHGRSKVVRGAVYGLVAGMYFGSLAVMVDAASSRASDAGVHGLFVSPRGLVPLMGIVLLGLAGVVLTQVSFQVGALSATLPANLAADPFTAVVLGAVLLHEHLPVDAPHIIGYALCFGAVVAGAVRLAEPTAGGHPATRDSHLAMAAMNETAGNTPATTKQSETADPA